jgi:GPH family glycoside/pentoside/hexuronide:cation symporter
LDGSSLTTRDTRLATRTKILYGLGDFAFSSSYTVVAMFFLFYLTDVARLSPALAGTALLITKLWDAVIDPFLGHLTDRTRTRWGRRRPYLLFGVVPFGLAFLALWMVPAGLSQFGMFAYVVVTMILYVTTASAMSIPYTAMTAELTPDYDERTSLTSYRMAVSILAGLISAAVPLALVAALGGGRGGFTGMAAAFAALIVLSPLITFFGTREPERGTPPRGSSTFSLIEGVRITLANRPFRLALTVYLFTQMGVDVLCAIFVYFLKYWMRMEGDTSPVLAVVFIVAVVCLPFWVWFSNRTSKKLAFIIGLGSLAAVLMGVILLQPGQVTAVYVLCCLAGVGVSAAHVIPWSIIPDCLEQDELVTGRRREGMFYGILTFLQQLASSVALFLTGMALSWSGYTPVGTQPESALWAIRIMLGPVTGIMFCLAIGAMLLYPISRQEHARVRRELEARREVAA